MKESFEEQGPEILRRFEELPMPGLFYELRRRITRPILPSEQDDENDRDFDTVVDGFDDVLDRPFGAGLFSGTVGSVFQLVFLLSIGEDPVVEEVLQDQSLDAREVISIFRKQQVLAGMKIIDLGCGVPNFAVAASALGATAYTADVEVIGEKYRSILAGHVVIDLNDALATETLLEATGGDFDVVSENIIGPTPLSSRKLSKPRPEAIVHVAAELLKENGYLYSEKLGKMEHFFRKK